MARAELVVVFDECISPRIAAAVEGFCRGQAGLTFGRVADGTKDLDWLQGRFPADPPHVMITKDSVLRPRAQTLVWLRGGLTVVIVDQRLGNITLEHLAATLLRWWPAIAATIAATPRQGAFVVPSKFSKRERLPKWTRTPRKARKARKPPQSKTKKAAKARSRDQRQTTLILVQPVAKS